MADIVQPTLPARYPKRKRAQVNYQEEESDIESQHVEEDSQDVDLAPAKKRKTISASKPLPKRKIFPFMELPAEIRNMIYGYCLTDPSGIYLNSTTKKFRRTVYRETIEYFRGSDYWEQQNNNESSDGESSESEDGENEREKKKTQGPPENRPLVPALLAVSKQIYKESGDILYGNDFHLGDTLTMHSFLVDIGPRAASLLKNVTLISWGEGRGVHKAYNHAGFAALSTAINLKKITIHGHTCYNSDGKSVATQFYRDAFPWLEAYGAANGKVDAAVDIINISNRRIFGGYYGWTYRERSGPYSYMDVFRQELSKLLNNRMKMIRS